MKKRMTVGLVILAFASGLFAQTTLAPIKIFAYGEEIKDVEVIEKDGMCYVPVRMVENALGINVEWNKEHREIYLGGNPKDLFSEVTVNIEENFVITRTGDLMGDYIWIIKEHDTNVSLLERNAKNERTYQYLFSEQGKQYDAFVVKWKDGCYQRCSNIATYTMKK